MRRLLDDGQRLLAEFLHDALGQRGPDAVDDAGGQEALDALGARRRLYAEARDLELLSEALMCRPVAAQAQLLADEGRLDIGDGRDAAVLAQGLEGKDGERSRFIRKDDALDDTLDLLLHLQPWQGRLDWSAFFVLHLAASSHRGCLRPRSGAPTSRSASRSPFLRRIRLGNRLALLRVRLYGGVVHLELETLELRLSHRDLGFGTLHHLLALRVAHALDAADLRALLLLFAALLSGLMGSSCLLCIHGSMLRLLRRMALCLCLVLALVLFLGRFALFARLLLSISFFMR